VKTRQTLAAVLSLLAAACGSGIPDPGGSRVQISVALTEQANRVEVRVTPANITQDLTPAGTNMFVGSLTLPVGEQTIRATAYFGGSPVGQGEVTVTIVAGANSAVYLTIFDTTGPAPIPDHGPIITSIFISKTTPEVNESVTFTSTAIDPDGDSLNYEWTQSCPSGHFGSPTEAATTWYSDVPTGCDITITVRSNGLSASTFFHLTASAPLTGSVPVTVQFVPNPRITDVALENSAGTQFCLVSRTGPSGSSCSGTIFPSQTLVVRFSYEGPGVTPQLLDDCGGQAIHLVTVSRTATFQWTAPPTMASRCMITPTVTIDPLSDSLPVALAIAACTDDADEPNDDYQHPTPLVFSVPEDVSLRTGLFANDEDWYSLDTTSDTAALRVTLTTADAIPVELYTSAGNTFVGAGVNGFAVAVLSSTSYRLHVLPGAAASTCQSAYNLKVERFSSSYTCTPNVVISQVYSGGGQAGAVYTNDFVELHNRSDYPVSLDGWTIQYGSATGTAWLPWVTLAGYIAPGGYYLVQLGGLGTVGSALPPPDASSGSNMSGTAAKVALVSSTTALPSGACPSHPMVVDFVLYGTTNCAATSPAPAPSASVSITRANNGCTWSGDNSADFFIQAPTPRNTISPVNMCSIVDCL